MVGRAEPHLAASGRREKQPRVIARTESEQCVLHEVRCRSHAEERCVEERPHVLEVSAKQESLTPAYHLFGLRGWVKKVGSHLGGNHPDSAGSYTTISPDSEEYSTTYSVEMRDR